MSDAVGWLPGLVLLQDCEGDWSRYIEGVYEFFRQDFILSSPTWIGQRVGIKRRPIVSGKEAGFWHLISEGEVEVDRLPDLRRCERIRWPRPIIEGFRDARVRCWRTRHKADSRAVIALDDFSYVVVLALRKGYVLLWTAYCVEREHRKRRLEREYENAQKC